MSTISDNIRSLRKQYFLTQEQLGEIAGVSDKAVSTWENGVAEPRMGAVRRMADHFNINISDILDGPADAHQDGLNASASLLAREILADGELKKAVSCLQHRPELIESVLKLSVLTQEELELINGTMERFGKGGRRRK
ncbi:MAG: helix-turn-helix transcriptional regulator [Mogibacterium sp.]|nr:helix-turn-helix transcriptional regulator [Mogibacterium sp.]